MPQPVVHGAPLQCSFGTAPGSLQVIPDKQVMTESTPMATIMDFKPMVNVPSFVTCLTLSNPTTASLTAAALGVLTPGPCTPVITGPWVPGSASILVRNEPALTDNSQCFCAYGGVITIITSPATREQIA